MVFNSLAVESELGGIFDGTGLLSQRPRRRRNSGEEEPGRHSLRHSIRCAQRNRWIQRVSPIQIARSMTAWHNANVRRLVCRCFRNRPLTADVIEPGPFQIPTTFTSTKTLQYIWIYCIKFYDFYDLRYYLD